MEEELTTLSTVQSKRGKAYKLKLNIVGRNPFASMHRLTCAEAGVRLCARPQALKC